MRATWLATVLRAAELIVVEWPEWQSYGDRELDDDLWGIVNHHTASAAGSTEGNNARALRTRSGHVPPPRAHMLIGRSGNVHVLSAMKANHAGVGSWPGVSSQAQLLGIEIDNNGVGEPYPEVQCAAVLRSCEAICAHMGWDASRVISHHEWAPTRKPDPRGPTPLYPWGGPGPYSGPGAQSWDLDLFRADLAVVLKPPPVPVPDEPEDRVLWIVTRKRDAPGDPNVGHWLSDGITRRKLKDEHDEALMVAAWGAKRTPTHGPFEVPGSTFDAIPETT